MDRTFLAITLMFNLGRGMAGMAEVDLKRFDIVNGQVQGVYEWDDGVWEVDAIEADERYTVSGSDVVHEERDDGWVETTLYRDTDGSGTYREISVSHSREGAGVSGTSDAALARLYMAVFDRSPDLGGFRYWEQQADRGMGVSDIAASFINGNEFQQSYGALDDSAFVDRLYLNVLDRPADSGGKDWWMSMLQGQSMNRQEVVVAFSESAEFVALSDPAVTQFLQLVGQPVNSDAPF